MRHYKGDISDLLSDYRRTNRHYKSDTLEAVLGGLFIALGTVALFWAFAIIGEIDLHGAKQAQKVEGVRI